MKIQWNLWKNQNWLNSFLISFVISIPILINLFSNQKHLFLCVFVSFVFYLYFVLETHRQNKRRESEHTRYQKFIDTLKEKTNEEVIALLLQDIKNDPELSERDALFIESIKRFMPKNELHILPNIVVRT